MRAGRSISGGRHTSVHPPLGAAALAPGQRTARTAHSNIQASDAQAHMRVRTCVFCIPDLFCAEMCAHHGAMCFQHQWTKRKPGLWRGGFPRLQSPIYNLYSAATSQSGSDDYPTGRPKFARFGSCQRGRRVRRRPVWPFRDRHGHSLENSTDLAVLWNLTSEERRFVRM